MRAACQKGPRLDRVANNTAVIGKVTTVRSVSSPVTCPEHGYALVDKRLFIPEKWFTEPYSERRQKCKLPPETVFKTKPSWPLTC